MSKLRVAVLMGGPDFERDVSIRSGTEVAKALRNTGEFYVDELVINIPSLDEIAKLECDIVFPVLHGPFGEGGPLQKLLERAEKTFVGSASLASEIAMDKSATKQIARGLGIRTPNWSLISKDTPCEISPPLVLKPVDDGSSVDVEICKTLEEVQKQQKRLCKHRNFLLAEEYIEGRELTVGIVNGTPLPIIEIIPPADSSSYDFDAKYQNNHTKLIVDPVLPPNDCVKSSMVLYESMEIRDLARVDFLLDNQGTWLLEINTMPGFTDHSLVPMAAKHTGLPMEDLCSELVHAAFDRRVKS